MAGPDGLCIYCNDVAQEWDHIPPKALRRQLTWEQWHEMGVKFRRVPACRDCNQIIGARPLFTVADRRARVREKLWRRHRKLILTPGWQAEELDQLEGRLKDYVKGMQKRKRHILQRVGMCRGGEAA